VTVPAPELLPAIEIEPEPDARSSVIWLHGLGADGNDFVPVVEAAGAGPVHLPARPAAAGDHQRRVRDARLV
jgi:predicted esterase